MGGVGDNNKPKKNRNLRQRRSKRARRMITVGFQLHIPFIRLYTTCVSERVFRPQLSKSDRNILIHLSPFLCHVLASDILTDAAPIGHAVTKQTSDTPRQPQVLIISPLKFILDSNICKQFTPLIRNMWSDLPVRTVLKQFGIETLQTAEIYTVWV